MKVVIPGGSGQIGRLLSLALRRRGDDVVVLSRSGRGPQAARVVRWDGRTLGAWAAEIDGADVVVNLAGRSVDCRYTRSHLRQMIDSRVDSTAVVGKAIGCAYRPPRVWLQMSTATIYAHRFDAPNDERTGLIGGHEIGVPDYWRFSVDIATAWERAQRDARTPDTRKVALRTAMVMSPERGGIFDVLLGLTRHGMGGAIAGGRQFVSWIHGDDFVRAVDHLIESDAIEGAVNVCAPSPLPQREFMAALRRAAHVRFGLPATRWMVELGAFLLRTDSELVLKSRRVVPARLLESGFRFEYCEWPEAAQELVTRWRRWHAAPQRTPTPQTA